MEVRKHPTHKRTWVVSVSGLVLLALIVLIVALTVHDPMIQRQPVIDWLIIAFMSLMGAAFAAMVFFLYLSRCPACGSYMRRVRSGDDDRIRFACRRCAVIFDSDIEESSD